METWDALGGKGADRGRKMLNSLRRLADVPDAALFETLSEGMRRIVDNAASLDETVRRLVGIGDFRGSEVMRGFAEEEAGKAL